MILHNLKRGAMQINGTKFSNNNLLNHNILFFLTKIKHLNLNFLNYHKSIKVKVKLHISVVMIKSHQIPHCRMIT